MFNNLDLSTLSVNDIVEEYKILHERHQKLKESADQDAQRIYELKRNLDTALAAEKYLTQELEHLTAQVQDACPKFDSREQQELEELRRKHNSLQLEHETLQLDYESKTAETCILITKLETATRDIELSVKLTAKKDHDEWVKRLNSLELENGELMQKLAEFEDIKVQHTFIVADQEKTIEILKDQVNCLEENMRCKRDELEEKLQLLETCQEQLVDANSKLALLTSAPEHNEAKGNSLFAEVDDQRQAMKHLLANQKKSYLEMKKIFNESKFEIRRLKRENSAMHTELQACSTIFCSADKTYQNRLNERIRQLMIQNAKLESSLNLTQERLRELASQKSVTWLDSMMDFCKRETDELKAQLHSMRIKEATLDEQMRNMQQQMARWRFESLKSRCVLIDRENLLMQHNIAFKSIEAMEFDINETELQAAKPRIVSVGSISTPTLNSQSMPVPTETIVLDTPLKGPAISVMPDTEVIVLDTPLKVEQQENIDFSDCQVSMVKLEPDDNKTVEHSEVKIELEREQCTNESVESDISQEIISKPIKKGTPVKAALGRIKVKRDQQLLYSKNKLEELLLPAKPNRKGTPIKFSKIKADNSEEDEPTLTPARPHRKGTPVKSKEFPVENMSISDARSLPKGTPVRTDDSVVLPSTEIGQVRSILTKRHDLFADTQKNVHFTSNEPIVHNLGPDICTSESLSKENVDPAIMDIKPVKKNQNIIRRIVVPSKIPATSALK